MKAADITPGDYEVKVYGKMKRVTIVGIKSQTYMAYSDYRDSRGHNRTAKFAIDDKDKSHTFQNVKRPWAEAAPEHEQAENAIARRDNALEALKDVLSSAWVGKGYYVNSLKDNGRIDIRLTTEEAEALVRRLS